MHVEAQSWAMPNVFNVRKAVKQLIWTRVNQLRLWVETRLEVPEGDWYKDFGSFKICGRGSYPETFLLGKQVAKG